MPAAADLKPYLSIFDASIALTLPLALLDAARSGAMPQAEIALFFRFFWFSWTALMSARIFATSSSLSKSNLVDCLVCSKICSTCRLSAVLCLLNYIKLSVLTHSASSTFSVGYFSDHFLDMLRSSLNTWKIGTEPRCLPVRQGLGFVTNLGMSYVVA